LRMDSALSRVPRVPDPRTYDLNQPTEVNGLFPDESDRFKVFCEPSYLLDELFTVQGEIIRPAEHYAGM
jgi:hypothetical protein